MDLTILFLLIAASIILSMMIKIAQDNERFAVYALGRFTGIKGPGLVLKAPGNAIEFMRIALGDIGEVQSNEFILINEKPLPFLAGGRIKLGSKVRITGFENSKVKVEAYEPQYITCENCGHQNPLN